MLFVVLVALGILLLLVGLVGCVLPVIPGPPVSFAGLIVLWAARGWEAHSFGVTTVLVLAALTVAVTIFDTVAPAWGAKRYGASKAGVWGSVLGMIVGTVFFPPFGMLVGAFLGAVLGEILSGKSDVRVLVAAWGVFVGTVAGILLKLGVSIAITVYFVIELFA